MRYLKYWWRPDSVVDPHTISGPYYGVTYDRWGRYVTVDEYDAQHIHMRKTQFVWKLHKVSRTYTYRPDGTLEFYQVYKYGWLGNLLGVEKYLPDGTLLHFESRDL